SGLARDPHAAHLARRARTPGRQGLRGCRHGLPVGTVARGSVLQPRVRRRRVRSRDDLPSWRGRRLARGGRWAQRARAAGADAGAGVKTEGAVFNLRPNPMKIEPGVVRSIRTPNPMKIEPGVFT